MNRPHRTVASVSVMTVLLMAANSASAQSAPGLDRRNAQVTRAAAGQPLTAASSAAPTTIVTDYLRAHGRASAVPTLRSASVNSGSRGMKYLRMQQEVAGLEVHGAYLKAAIKDNGELVHVIDRLANATTVAPGRIDARAALDIASKHLYPNASFTYRSAGAQGKGTAFDGGAFFHGQPNVTQVALALADGSLASGWRVETWAAQSNQLHYTIVNGEGQILEVESRTANDSYNVFVVDPEKSAQQVVAGPGAGNVESPAGWLDAGTQSTFQIGGNNVESYLDTSGRNRADRGGTTVTTGQLPYASKSDCSAVDNG